MAEWPLFRIVIVSETQNNLEQRIDRLESIEAIRQLAGKYSLSLDMRDIDAHVGLFVPDVRVGGGKSDEPI